MFACSPPTIISFTEMANSLPELHQAHGHMLKTGLIDDTFAASRLITSAAAIASFCSTSLDYAHSVFSRTHNPNSYMYNTLIRAHANSPSPENAVLVFEQMLYSLAVPDKYTYTFALKGCANFSGEDVGKQIQSHVYKMGIVDDVYIQNTLVHMYGRSGSFDVARGLLDKMPLRDVVSWNALLSAYVEKGMMDSARCLFDEMDERNLETWNFMVSGYVNVGSTKAARGVFNEMPIRNVVSWNAMITGYVQDSRFSNVLSLFAHMQHLKVKPDECTLVSVLTACARLGALRQGEWIHAYIDKNGFAIEGFLATALVDMYSKCGDIGKALEVFNSTSRKDISTCNSMITGLSIHGCGDHALKIFSEMQANGFTPNELTFISVLSACSRTGMLDEGRKIFDLMGRVHKIQPSIQHYGCMVDLLGRFGLLEEAEELARRMPLEHAPVLWESLLGACRNHGNAKMAERVAQKLFELNPQSSTSYVQLSNTYASMGRWNDAVDVRRKMRTKGVPKEPGCSMIEVDGNVHEFLAGEGMMTQE